MWRQNTGFAPCFERREHQQPEHRARRQRGDVRRLAIGCDHPLELTPELIHGVELGRLLRQPHKANAQPVRERLGLSIGMRARAIGDQPDYSRAAVVVPQLEEKGARIRAPRSRPRQHDTVAGLRIHGAEEHCLRVGAGDHNGARGPNGRPRGAQRREEAQQRPVGEEHDIARRDCRSQAATESPFFCATCAARSLKR